MLTAKDIMNKNVVSVRPETTVDEAIDILIAKGISGLLVTDSTDQPLGVVTEFGLLAVAYDPEIGTEAVGNHMTKDIIAVNETDPVNKVADMFILHRIRRIFVASGDHVVGLISRRDVLKVVREHREAVSTIDPQCAVAP
jgi:CBS domain-containing protein